MDYFLLPESIKSKLPKGGDTPEVFNCAGGIDGGQGSCYLVSLSDELLIFYKDFGQDHYQCLTAKFSDPAFSISLVKDKFNVFLAVACSAWDHKFRFSNFDASKLESFAAKHGGRPAASVAKPQRVEPTVQPSTDSLEIEPFIGLLAALLMVGHHDGNLDSSEEAFIRTIAEGADSALDSALKVFDACDAETLAVALSALSKDDRFCIVANMYDLAMADGLLRASEQQFILDFAEHMRLSNAECVSLRDALLAKARVALLKAGGVSE